MIRTTLDDERLCSALKTFRTEVLQSSLKEYSEIVHIDVYTLMRAEIRMTASARNFLLLMYLANLRVEDFIDEEEGVGVQKTLI